MPLHHPWQSNGVNRIPAPWDARTLAHHQNRRSRNRIAPSTLSMPDRTAVPKIPVLWGSPMAACWQMTAAGRRFAARFLRYEHNKPRQREAADQGSPADHGVLFWENKSHRRMASVQASKIKLAAIRHYVG